LSDEIKYARLAFTNDLAEKILGVTVLVVVRGHGGRTNIPKQVMETLKLRYSPQKREKLLWTQEGEDVVVTKGTLQSDFRKTILSRGDSAAVPKHVCEALKLQPMPHREERLVWIQRGKDILVRTGTPRKT
jgi:hypothetical protein